MKQKYRRLTASTIGLLTALLVWQADLPLSYGASTAKQSGTAVKSAPIVPYSYLSNQSKTVSVPIYDEIQYLKDEITRLKQEIAALKSQQAAAAQNGGAAGSSYSAAGGRFTTNSANSYRLIDGDSGSFLVGLDSVTTESSGSRYCAVVKIGNPSLTTYRSVDVKVMRRTDLQSAPMESSNRIESLPPGSWSTFEVRGPSNYMYLDFSISALPVSLTVP